MCVPAYKLFLNTYEYVTWGIIKFKIYEHTGFIRNKVSFFFFLNRKEGKDIWHQNREICDIIKW